jgi:ribosomal protein S18 acetylase RimI-like enzyme
MRTNLVQVDERAAYWNVLVALDGRGVRGAVNCTSSDVRPADGVGLIRLVPEDWAYLGALAVDPDRRGLEIGRALTHACIERAREEEAPAIGLVTRAIRRAPQGLYEVPLGPARRATSP